MLMMTFKKSLETCLKYKYATMSGRASRAEFWWFQLFIFIIDVLIIAIANLSTSEDQRMSFFIVYLIFSAVTLIPYLCVFVRRLHDRGLSGAIFWWALLISIWGVLLIGLIINMLGSDKGSNKYGPNPSEQSEDDLLLTSHLELDSTDVKPTIDEQTEEITDVEL